jgi:LacI family transcriptional regulator, repressor for deo operon, udp, cdd, tsx, nupC, and nupG
MSIFDKIIIDPKLEMTLSQQIREQIAWLIMSGELKAERLLPSVRRLASQLSINMHTVRSAYLRLEREGYVEIHQGRQTRVLPYNPIRLAQKTLSRRTNTVGVILPSLINPLYHSFLQGIEDISRQNNMLLIVCDAHDDLDEAFCLFLQLSAKQVDGVIVSSLNITQDLISISNGQPSRSLPLVTVDWPGSPGHTIQFDLENAGYLATRHLVEHGHRRIDRITFAVDVPNIASVNAGYERALQEAGIDVSSCRTARVYGFDIAAGMEGANMLLALPEPPAAIFAITDLLAIGAMRAVHSAGLRIPEDIAFTGCNDISLAELVDPPLTTVAAPERQMGQEAMKILQSLITGEQPENSQITLPVSLVVRQSCGKHD